ncbi:MAG: hypothetical protein M3491_04385 [Actinomycetota bacterium]|jgi:hypothetical protein|nr:hypothetical protein [Rubrobacteraceae bacterium]MDQ3251187.1 hypothetical protein [Actinomycetota bacterium]MDQ3436566.1 hypothetical protein [Actinomycetota bacterium]
MKPLLCLDVDFTVWNTSAFGLIADRPDTIRPVADAVLWAAARIQP